MGIMVLKPDRAKLEAKLIDARRRLRKRPHAWFRLEAVGRILRALGDPEADAYLRRAAANYKVGKGRAGDHMRLGSLHRLAGDREAAQRQFERAHALYAEGVHRGDPHSLAVEHMIPASFLTGRDDEVAELIALLRAMDPDKDLIAYPIAKMAEARRARDADLAAEAVADVAGMIRRSHAKVWESGGLLLWDWYEIAVQLWQDLSGRAPGERGGEVS